MKHICLVCNYQGMYDMPYDHRGVPSDEICPCCGFHYGYDDDGICKNEESYDKWRDEWIKNGCVWFSEGRKPPANWNPAEQLNQKK